MITNRMKTRVPSPVPGLSVSRSKSGRISVRKLTGRTLDYVTYMEVKKLSSHYRVGVLTLCRVFREKGWIVARDRQEAEFKHSKIKGNI